MNRKEKGKGAYFPTKYLLPELTRFEWKTHTSLLNYLICIKPKISLNYTNNTK